MTTASGRRILLHHPNALTRAEIRAQLENGVDVTTVQELSSLRNLLASAEAAYDVLIFSPDRAPDDMADVVRKLKMRAAGMHLVAYVKPSDAPLFRALSEAGVAGFLAEGGSVQEAESAVRAVQSDGAYLSLPVFQAVTREAAGGMRDAFGLTAREKEILSFISAAASNKEIARRLKLSVRTVETHRLNIRKKTLARSRRDLVSIAEKLGLNAASITLDPPAETGK